MSERTVIYRINNPTKEFIESPSVKPHFMQYVGDWVRCLEQEIDDLFGSKVWKEEDE